MAKDVEIQIQSKQISLDSSGKTKNAEDIIESKLGGQMFQKGDSVYLLYDEILDENSQPVKSQIKIMPGQMQLRRSGDVTVTMLFEKGKTNKTGYITPYGTFAMCVYTSNLSYEIREDYLKIDVEYELELNDAPLSKCNMHITAK